jgi:ubiquinone/menaquinone biosynthesis C-methylase UbiE
MSIKEVVPKNIVRSAYEDPLVVARYNDRKLWKSEEILIQRFFPKEGTVLDIGCGTGRTSINLARTGVEVVAVDLSSEMVKAAKQESDRLGLDIDFRTMDATSLEFADGTFDAALFSANGIDHVPGYNQKLEVVKEAFRVLKPGAPFIFSVHRIWSPVHLPRMLMCGMRLMLGKIFRFDTLEKEWGELYDLNAATQEEGYGQFLSSGKWRKAINIAGFDLVYNQSRYKLECGSSLMWLRRSLTSENFMFYVVRKPGDRD